MTKNDFIEELRLAKAEAEEDASPLGRGQALALEYAIDLAKTLRTRVPYATSKNVNVSFTIEQAKRVGELLGTGALDKAIRAKLERGFSAVCK